MGCQFDKVPLVTIPDFYNLNFIQRGGVKKVIDKNYKLHFYQSKKSGGYNFPLLDDTSFFNKLYDKFLDTSRELFGEINLSPDNSSTCWAYRGNKNDMGKRESNWWHNHEKTSTINAVYYLQVYNDGVSFIGLDGKIFDYLPKNNELIIFPADLVHSPQPNTLQKYRYSVNMEIRTQETVTDLFSRVFKYGFS
tara:strand:+ start:157 stop:735 length:579 start_codon:yes stop_codon:yes gene_type:complete